MTNIIGSSNSIFNQFVAEIRDVNVQNDSMRFRRNLERMGEIMAYELSKKLSYKTKEVTTPLGETEIGIIEDEIVIGTILRAGLPLHQGVLNYFDKAQNAFISAYRKHHKDNSFEIAIEYLSSPSLDGKILILTDPMLATGSSMVLAYKGMLSKGTPKHTHIISAIASKEGLSYVEKHIPSNMTIWVGAVDDELTVQSYIVPGLGDAGDLAYGTKL
ncbi:MAG: uracil phosphoribosyltransferase [Bacteroidia bacterium]|nr:uracil phosphoribosyltransferase [Bacteroidia bacterium]